MNGYQCVPLATLLTLMAVMAKAILRLPSMFVLRTRRICWNFSGMTSDCENKQEPPLDDALNSVLAFTTHIYIGVDVKHVY